MMSNANVMHKLSQIYRSLMKAESGLGFIRLSALLNIFPVSEMPL